MTALQKDNHYIDVLAPYAFEADLVGRWPGVYQEAVEGGA